MRVKDCLLRYAVACTSCCFVAHGMADNQAMLRQGRLLGQPTKIRWPMPFSYWHTGRGKHQEQSVHGLVPCFRKSSPGVFHSLDWLDMLTAGLLLYCMQRHRWCVHRCNHWSQQCAFRWFMQSNWQRATLCKTPGQLLPKSHGAKGSWKKGVSGACHCCNCIYIPALVGHAWICTWVATWTGKYGYCCSGSLVWVCSCHFIHGCLFVW